MEASQPINYERTNYIVTDNGVLYSSIIQDDEGYHNTSPYLQHPKPIPNTNKISFIENLRLHIADLDANKIITIEGIKFHENYLEYAWVDEKTFLYTKSDTKNNQTDIMQFDIIQNQEILFEEDAFAPNRSCRGEYISYLKDDETAILKSMYSGSIVSINVERFDVNTPPIPSPDGDYLLYSYCKDVGNYGIAVFNLSNNKIKVINGDVLVDTLDWID